MAFVYNTGTVDIATTLVDNLILNMAMLLEKCRLDIV